jgi:hypothetical protein
MPYFDRVQRFCFFIAPSRSGHSIVAHLLCAHPDVLISDELNALQYFSEGYTAAQVYALIKVQDMRSQNRGRKKSGYDYSVGGTAQSDEKKHPLVIGDAKGAGSAAILASDPELIQRVRAAVGVPLRVIIHVRHPFDSMATTMRRRDRDLSAVIEAAQAVSNNLEKAADLLSEDEVLFQTHEELIANPTEQFERLFRFLDVEPIPEIVNACANKIWNVPHKTRKALKWQSGQQERLVDVMGASRYFAHYFSDGQGDPVKGA